MHVLVYPFLRRSLHGYKVTLVYMETLSSTYSNSLIGLLTVYLMEIYMLTYVIFLVGCTDIPNIGIHSLLGTHSEYEMVCGYLQRRPQSQY